MKTTVRYYRMDRRQISFVKFILEGYDNLAVVTTLDPPQALVQVTIAPGCETVVGGVLKSFGQAFEIVNLDRPAAREGLEGPQVAAEKGISHQS